MNGFIYSDGGILRRIKYLPDDKTILIPASDKTNSWGVVWEYDHCHMICPMVTVVIRRDYRDPGQRTTSRFSKRQSPGLRLNPL
jgi:hypothetical protein